MASIGLHTLKYLDREAPKTMNIDDQLVSREELQRLATTVIKSVARIEETLEQLAAHDSTELISELSEAEEKSFICVTLVTERLLADARSQFKDKPKFGKQGGCDVR
jgi:hypothetical protein